MRCEYKGCNNNAEYSIEWWGLDQDGKNPTIVDELHTCNNPEHVVNLSKHQEFGGYPDEIQSIGNYEPKTAILYQVKDVIDGKLEKIDISVADPLKEQLRLF
jgi:hypothetical protein